MPKKPDLSKAFGERFKTEEKVDVQDPIAAAVQASKDTEKHEGIHADTDVPMNAVQSVSLPESVVEGKDARMHARTDASENVSIDESMPERKPSRKSAGRQVNRDASEEAYIGKGVIIEVLYDQIQQKKHLSNGSFRYKADELEKLDAIFKDLEAKKPGRISKNDIARMALIAFYEDYEKNGDESILAQVFRRM